MQKNQIRLSALVGTSAFIVLFVPACDGHKAPDSAGPNRPVISTAAPATAAPERCRTANPLPGYPHDFPFVNGGSVFESSPVPGAFLYSIPEQDLTSKFVACLQETGWNVRMAAEKESAAPQTRYRFSATRNKRLISGSIFTIGRTTLLIVEESGKTGSK